MRKKRLHIAHGDSAFDEFNLQEVFSEFFKYGLDEETWIIDRIVNS